MTKSPRALIILGMSLFLLGFISVDSVFSETQEKEGAPEKPSSRPPHPPAASDGQSKPSTETKPQSQPNPATKADLPPAEYESKEKDSAAKRPLGSLIL